MAEELFQLVDPEGRPRGVAPRAACHGNPSLLHAVVHLHVLDGEGRLFLQKRAATKDRFPSTWDTAVGGHIGAGEPVAQALAREAREELGLALGEEQGALRPLFRYVHGDEAESELVHAFALTYRGPFTLDPVEVSEGRFFDRSEIEGRLGTGFFTPNFEEEYAKLRALGLP